MATAVKEKVVYLIVAMILLSSLLAYFVKPKPPLAELVSPEQELPTYQAPYPGGTALADRIIKSYRLAMVLVHSPYTQRNIISLENIRSWARERFQRQPDFLHPATLTITKEPYDTIFGALTYHLVTPVRYWLESLIGELLRFNITRFHETLAYHSFQTAYFDLFGVDADAAALLARYQSDKAKMAVGTLLSALFWLSIFAVGLIIVLQSSASNKLKNARLVMASVWGLGGLYYLFSACHTNDVSKFTSGFLSLLIGGYLAFPFTLSLEGSTKIRAMGFTHSRLALVIWISYSLLAIQLLTWIRAGLPNNLDPVTLLLSSVSGNFLHDPVNGKRLISRMVGIIWIILGVWTFWQSKINTARQRELDEKLASLSSSYLN